MANKFARSNGDFNNASIWSLLAGSMSATTVPTIGDNASANTFTIQITGNVACDNITNGTAYGGTAGGTFNLNNGVSLSANIVAGNGSGLVSCSVLSGSNTAIIQGNLSNSSTFAATALTNTSTGALTVTGDLNGAAGASSQTVLIINNVSGITYINGNVRGGSVNGLSTAGSSNVIIIGNFTSTGNGNTSSHNSTGTMTINGNITSSATGGNGVQNTGTGSIVVNGNITGGTGNGVSCTNASSTGSITVYGNVVGGVSTGLQNTSTGSVTVLGNVIGDSRGGAGITSTNAAANVRISGNLIGAPNGIPAVYAASYTVNPIPSQTYIRYANNGTGVGSDAYLYHYTTDSLSAFSMPPVSAVRSGLQYANNTLTGTCQIPPISSVVFGAPVDNTTGTAILTSNNLWETPSSSLTATNSIGARLKNSATIESVGRILASFTF